jgi:hypothetical protein
MSLIKRAVFFISVLILLFLMLGGASAHRAAAAPAARAKWTIMVYQSGDNDLESYVPLDLETELAALGSNADVQVVSLADRHPEYDDSAGDWTGTLLFHVTQGMTATPNNAVADWGERNFGNPQTLIDFVTWTKTNYPADHYALFFWGHGWAWRTDYTMLDETSNDTLDMHELAAAMPSLGFIDVVGYDACNMASIEVQSLWSNNAAAIVHSQEWVNMDGLEYDATIAALRANPNLTADQVAIVTNEGAGVNSEKTYSAVALDGRWDTLRIAVDEWAAALQAGLPTYKKQYDNAFRSARNFWQDPSGHDLYGAAAAIKNKVNNTNIKNKSQAVMDAVNAVVLDEWHVGGYSGAHGITIYIPTRASELNDPTTTVNDFTYYRTLGFSLSTRWDEFLKAYQNVP